MNKFFLLLIICLPLTLAAEPITVLTLHYEDGDISYVKESSTTGYAPTIYEGDYELRIFSDNQLLSLNFLPPVDEFQDGFNENEIYGGLIKRDNFDFSLIIPRISDEEEKIIIQPNGKKVELKKSNSKNYLLSLILFLILVSIILLVRKLRS